MRKLCVGSLISVVFFAHSLDARAEDDCVDDAACGDPASGVICEEVDCDPAALTMVPTTIYTSYVTTTCSPMSYMADAGPSCTQTTVSMPTVTMVAMGGPRRRRNRVSSNLQRTARTADEIENRTGVDGLAQRARDMVTNGQGSQILDVGAGWAGFAGSMPGGMRNQDGVRSIDPQLPAAITAFGPHMVAGTAQDLGTDRAFPNGDFSLVIMANTIGSIVTEDGEFDRDDFAEAMEGVNRVTHPGSELVGTFNPIAREELANAGWEQVGDNPNHWVRPMPPMPNPANMSTPNPPAPMPPTTQMPPTQTPTTPMPPMPPHDAGPM